MNHHFLRLKSLILLSAVIFTALLYLLGGLFLPVSFHGISADASEYLKLSSFNFRSVSALKQSGSLLIDLTSYVDLPEMSPAFSYELNVDDEEFSLYNGNDAKLNLRSVARGATAQTLSFNIKLKNGSTSLENAINLNKIVVLPGAKLGSPNDSEYLGIEFVDGLTLIKDDDVWSLQAVGGESGEDEEEREEYEAQLNATNVAIAWNETSDLLEATIELPFSAETDLSYTSDLSVFLNDAAQTYTAIQYENESKIRLLFEDYVAPSENEIPCIRIEGGDLIHSENDVTVTATGSVTFYEYVDKTWSTERYVQVKETVLGETTERKIKGVDTYTFAKPQAETDKLYVGWSLQGELMKTGETFDMLDYTKRTLETEAVLLDYKMVKGASIRYDRTGDDSGIRFASKLSMEDFASFEEYILGVGIIIMPSNLLGDAEFTYENYGGEGEAKNFFAPSEEISSNGDEFTLYAAIVKILESNYNREFSARAYLLTKDNEYLWTTDVQKRSVYEVATAIMEKEKENPTIEDWQLSSLETYINNVANIKYESGEAEVISSSKSPVITAAEVEKDGNLVTLKLTTEKTSFSGITYNGKRVKDATQNYADGILTVTFDETKTED